MFLEEVPYLQGLGIRMEISELENPWSREQFHIRK